MATILSNRGRPAYGVKKLMVNSVEDILNIPLSPTLIRPGSTVFVVNTESKYVLTPEYTWIELGADQGSDSGNIETIYEGGDLGTSDGVTDEDLEYEGGDLETGPSNKDDPTYEGGEINP